LNAALSQAIFYIARDVDKSAPGWDVEPEFFSIGFHHFSSLSELFYTFYPNQISDDKEPGQISLINLEHHEIEKE
jgi:hypothetical protein